ncbi:MAG: BPSS1780 family membrane protein [Candidatus Thiothrix putei]|uniref:BPSS1780 family membrane protein n=1 Tax=Candidatus Thiothrix putei TaxID=3080811 RepID=A0AA95KQL7_9GAMM|nr:MAG: BPSS1780 family membrane protein [Candidatus Thiothrix putei]
MNDKNPYQPPQSDVTPPPINVGNLTLLAEPRALSAGAGLSWLADSWALVKSNLVVWVLITLVLFVIQFVLGIVPVVGDIVSSLIGPVLTGGILMGARAIAAGDTLRFEHLFAGFKENLVPLLGLGALTLGIVILFGIIIGGAFVGMNMDLVQSEMRRPEDLLSGVNTGLIAVGVILLLLVMMLFWFATQLVALNNVPVFQALSMSFKACLRNPLALIVYSLLMVLLLILGMIPLLLGLLVVVPWMFASMYVSYRQIFLK